MDSLDRLYWRLVESIRRDPTPGAPLTVGEVYQNRIPYRVARSEVGFAELAAYEHALLRLLAGERGYVRLEQPEIQEEFARELRSPNPIVGMYRDHAGASMRVRPPGPVPTPEEERVAKPSPPPPVLPSADPASPREPSAGCSRCGVVLPSRRAANYCPGCGGALRSLPCRGCGAAMEPEWIFCVDCGQDRRLPGAERLPTEVSS